MRIAVINETSAADKNADILAALDGRGHEIVNAGMTRNGAKPELTYIHTGFISALLLNAGEADFVVGGCGTGQGFLNSVMQYPGVVCGHILNPLDAWLFAQINAGNCVSLALNQGYGWAGDVNLRFIFDRLFSVERGAGYPAHRRNPSANADRRFEPSRGSAQAVRGNRAALPDAVLRPAIEYPGILELVDPPTLDDARLKTALNERQPG